MTETTRWRFIQIIMTISNIAIHLVIFVIAIFIAYLVSLFFDERIPSTFDFSISPYVVEGGEIELSYTSIVRIRKCDYTSTLYVTDTNQHRWYYPTVEATTVGKDKGKMPDVHVYVRLDTSLEPGVAQLTQLINYRCNLLEYIKPLKVILQANFTILPKNRM